MHMCMHKCMDIRDGTMLYACVKCPAWEQLLAVQEAEQRLYRCDDVKHAWLKAATQREIGTVRRCSGAPVKTHFQTQPEDQVRKKCDVSDLIDYFSFHF